MDSSLFELRGCRFLGAWIGVVGLHCVCAMYLTQLARVYSFFMHPYMDYWAKLIARERHQYFGHVAWIFGILAGLHWWQIFSILWASLRARELVLPDGSSNTTHYAERIKKKLKENGSHRRMSSSRFSSMILTARRLKKLTLPTRIALRFWRVLFSRRGFFGIESDYFPLIFIVREVVEIVSQTFQAHRSSASLPRPWLNNLFATLVVVNCWSTPVLQHVFRCHRGMERVVCLVLDTLLNMGSSVVIPIVIFLPYYEAFMPEYFTFPYTSLYDALFFSRLAMENHLLFSMSTSDLISRVIPHLGIYSSLVSAATLIRRKGSRRTASKVTAGVPPSKAETPLVTSFSKTFAKIASVVTASPTNQSLAARASRKKKTLMHIVFGLWGLGVLVLHMRAAVRLRETVVGCRQVTGSWFATGFPCTVYAYNCFRHGTASPDEDSWVHLDQSSLVYLTISHCPALKVPHRFQSFPNLLGFQLHNITLVEWAKENAISATKHAKMIVCVIAKTNMTRLPDGMLQPLPDTLMDIEITHTNLTSLPPDLHERWHSLACMYLEHSLLTAFPETLLHLDVTEISLLGNRIETLPELALKHQYFYSFVASANPLRELPDTLGDGTEFSYFSAENTLLETLPAWAHTRVEDTMFLYGTPFCQSQTEDTRNSGVLLACQQRDNRVEGKVAIDIFDPRIPLYQE